MNSNRTTPEWVDSLKENEIFVFGCRNSGRHFDGASAFALRHFGAIMGQREGRQGQSYAIPTIGGDIGLKKIRQSVRRFTQYAAEHPELHFLVTAVGCGGGGWHPQKIAPLFAGTSKLPNISLPQDFWNELNKNFRIKCSERFEAYCSIFFGGAKSTIQEILYGTIGYLPAKVLYGILASNSVSDWLRYHEIDLNEGMSLIVPNITLKPEYEEYIINHNTKCAYMLRGHNGKFRIDTAEIDWDSVGHLPAEVQDRIRNREVKFFSSGLFGGYHHGVIGVMWTVCPDGKTYYLDKYYGGPQTDEKQIVLYGFIDTRCRFVVKMQVVADSEHDKRLNRMRIEAEKIVSETDEAN